jgi:hypothetical protein
LLLTFIDLSQAVWARLFSPKSREVRRLTAAVAPRASRYTGG